MIKAFGTVRHGQLELDSPVEWPDGTRVLVLPDQDEHEDYGITESEWADSEEQRRDWLAWFDSREPLDMTPEELAAWEAERQASRELQKEFTRQSWEALDRLSS